MPLARSTFYDIKLRAQNMVEKYRDQKSGVDFYNNKSDNIDRNLVYIQFKK